MPYTRLTVIGGSRKADLVMPDDEPVGSLLPQLLEILDERAAGGREVRLSTLTGLALSPEATLADQGVAHGSMIQLTTIDDAPQPPDVVDITDAVAIAAGNRRDRWVRATSTTLLAILACVFAYLAAHATLPALWDLGSPDTRAVIAAAVALAGAGAFMARRSSPSVAGALGSAAFGTCTALLLSAGQAWSLGLQAVLVAGGAWAVVGIILGIGMRRLSALAGASVGLVAAGVLSMAHVWGWPRLATLIVTALAAMVLIGLVPGIALALSGLTRYDDGAMRGERAQRVDVDSAIQEGFATLSWTVAALAIPGTTALMELVTYGSWWALGLAVVVCLVLLLRARVLPLIPQRLALFTAGALPLLLGLLILDSERRAPLATLLCAGMLALSTLRVSAVTAARLRRPAEIAELLLVILAIPLALGALDIYADLLEVFR